jgi:hypothetical protein
MSNLYRKKAFAPKAREIFDAENQEHVLDYASFIKYNSWKGGCNYLLEDPYMDIPTMINAKLVTHYLKEHLEHV